MCKTEQHENNASPLWDRCCFVHGSHSHSEYVFSVFDGDYSSEEGDWLGTAVLPANATAGVYELPLAGGEFEPQEGTLLIEIPLAPPPPPPPADDRAKQLKYDVSSKLLLDSAKGGEGEERKFLCIMSASGLVETDFYPRVGKSRSAPRVAPPAIQTPLRHAPRRRDSISSAVECRRPQLCLLESCTRTCYKHTTCTCTVSISAYPPHPHP